MASVVDFSDGARFVVRVQSSLASNRRVRWFNTYEVRSTSSGNDSDIQQLASNIGVFQANVSYNYIYVDDITVSTWEHDSHPYNPLGFLTFTLNSPGVVALGEDTPVSLRQTLFLKRAVSSGLQGKLFLRGALSGVDIEYSDGDWALDNPGSLQSRVNTAFTTADITDYFNGVEATQFYFCMMGDAGETRPIGDLLVAGTSDVKLNHKYFDRS